MHGVMGEKTGVTETYKCQELGVKGHDHVGLNPEVSSQEPWQIDRETSALISRVIGLPLCHVIELARSQPMSMSLAGFIQGAASGDVKHPRLTIVARERLVASLKLHLFAARGLLQGPRQQYHPQNVKPLVIAELSGFSREGLLALFLDVQFRLLESDVLFWGSIDTAVIFPRVVASRALIHHASHVVVAHNHPFGSRTPSHADINATKKLAKALKVLDITLLDHLIVAGGSATSLRNLGFV